MSYLVLARKWRPRSFGELVGQEHVVRALTNALDNDRLHHAYLFTGTRGVGKTTLARIFAKSVNCEQGVGSRPCGQCSACREIDEGRFADLLEVDAASRTKVEQTRELLENVPYAPVRGRYKVYLIDEVHMFSDSSFNALLKTLEEPPPHVKFLLATTDPQKVPVTVLSRCLQLNLKRMPVEQIRGHLENVLGREGLAFEAPALALLARAADGSMRDSLSLLDQAIAFGGGRVTEADVRAMLGALEGEHAFHLLEALAADDPAGVLQRVAEVAERAPDFGNLLQEMIALLHRVALCQLVPDAIDDGAGDEQQVRTLAGGMTPEDVQLYYQIGLIGQRDLPLAPDPRSGFEMVLLRMLAFRPDAGPAAPRGGPRPAPAPGRASGSPVAAARAQLTAPTAAAPATLPAPGATAEPAPPPWVSEPPSVVTPPPAAGFDPAQWPQLVAGLRLGGVARQLAGNCACIAWETDRIQLTLDPAHKGLLTESVQLNLRKALEQHFGRALRLEIRLGAVEAVTPAQIEARQRQDRQQGAEEAIAADPLVQALTEQYGARVVAGSVKPLE
jgi:DNA polymerase III subunit gamma/tau